MKKAFLVSALVLFAAVTAHAQPRYCEVKLTLDINNRMTGGISYGEKYVPLIDSTDHHFVSFYNDVAAINYMAERKWKFVSAMREKEILIHLYFVKEDIAAK